VVEGPSVSPGNTSPAFEAFPGTVSLSVKVYTSLVEEIVRSLHRQGLRGVMVVIGHGGNFPVLPVLNKLANDVASLACGEAQAAIDRMGARVQSNLCGPSLICAYQHASST